MISDGLRGKELMCLVGIESFALTVSVGLFMSV